MGADRDQAIPLAVGAERVTSDEENTSPKPRRRRCCLICGGSCAAALLVLVAVVVALALTVFKVKEPVMTMNSVTVQRFAIAYAPASPSSSPYATALPFAVNMTVVADVSVKNPNAASVRFGASTTAVYYRGREMGVALGPPGIARARRTLRLNVTVEVMADRILGDGGLLGDLAAGSIAVVTSTKVGGRVRVLGVFRHHVDVVMNCSITMAVANQSILYQSCRQKVWL